MIDYLRKSKIWVMLLMDCLFVIFSYYLAYLLRFDGNIPASYLSKFIDTSVWIVPLNLGCFFFFNLYRGMWRYTGIYDLVNLFKACFISTVVSLAFLLFTVRFSGFPRSVFVIYFVLTFFLVGGFRVVIRLYYAHMNEALGLAFRSSNNSTLKRLLIIGAGDATEYIMREIRNNPNLQYDVVGLIDDDPSKLKRTIHGVPVLSTIDEMAEFAKINKANEILISIPSASVEEKKRISKFCEDTGLPFKTFPGIAEFIEGKVTVTNSREIHHDDLRNQTSH